MNVYLSVGLVALVTDEDLLFPGDYPTGCLLGYVDMVDCLPQEEYRDQVGVVSHRGQLFRELIWSGRFVLNTLLMQCKTREFGFIYSEVQWCGIPTSACLKMVYQSVSQLTQE